MSLLEKFKEYIKQQNLFQSKDKLLLAVSGGVDSVVLCELCKQAGYDFMIAHCNFQLRGEESERDGAFVKQLAEKYEVEVLVKKFDTQKYADENKLSIQVAARELRYSWFAELLQKIKTDFNLEVQNSPFRGAPVGERTQFRGFLLTAHHANDNIETLLMNFFKGTGINGLHGILPKQGNIIRPLLFAKKEQLSEFAVANNLNFVEDSSNASDKYTRNYFRNQLIPDLQKVFPQAEENLLNNIERFREIETLYQQSVQLNTKKLLEKKGNEIHIPVLKLLKTAALNTIVYEIIKDYGFTAHQTDEVVGLLKSDTGKYISSATHRIIKNRNWLIIAPNKTTEAENIFIEEDDRLVVFQQGQISLELFTTQNLKPQTQNHIAQLNAANIKFPLLLRKWKTGDYFYPLGMKKKKKLNRFFIDQKLSLTQKEKTWVIEMDKKIIWVVGLRVDDRFKITDSTKNILQISLTIPQ
jgi:tRNA(Ile)-lysidine synthase